MNAQRLGIITSLAIHGGFLVLFLSIPIANAIPYTKTIIISFAQQEASPSVAQKATKTIVKPQTGEVRNISKSEVAEIKHHQDEVILNDNQIITAAQTAEIQTDAKTEFTSLIKAENQEISETVFGNSGAPAFIHRETPMYPYLAKRFGKEGKVVLKLLIDKSGNLQDIETIEPSGFGFTEAAIEAIKKSTFAPAYRNGEKIVSRAILSVRFILK
ncbi:MAG: energy transducer TonB [Syntrophaceae bacterium]